MLHIYAKGKEHELESSQLFAKHWRGRMGLSKEQQLALHSRQAQASAHTEPAKPHGARLKVPFVTWEGETIVVDAEEGQSIMEAAKAAGLPSIEGICEGKLEVPHSDAIFFLYGF